MDLSNGIIAKVIDITYAGYDTSGNWVFRTDPNFYTDNYTNGVLGMIATPPPPSLDGGKTGERRRFW